MDFQKLLLKKWFWYSLIFLALLCFSWFLLPIALEGNELAANFLAEVFGLLFTVVILFMFLETRELLEWKSVEERVRRRIGSEIEAIFIRLADLCEIAGVGSLGYYTDEELWKKQKEEAFKTLTSGEIKFNREGRKLWDKEKLASSLASYFDSRRAYLSEIEGKYLKFLDSELQASLMDIQDHLKSLNVDLTTIRGILQEFEGKKENFYQSLSDSIRKTMAEIAKIRDREIDLGF